jgi:predicted DNA-binding protein YlxM (UPF0122 family)|tara:strand:- start:392 stop:601 length:210 start_codon:yes stop_codon:yes gene_type:complete
MKKRMYRTTRYLKALQKKVVDYYFKNPETNSLTELSEMFNLNKKAISDGISNELKKRRENSLAGKYMRQ